MTVIYSAATTLVNPPGATPVITPDQLWAALELKRTQPQLFLPVIDTCKVLEDGEVVLREVTFKDAGGVGTAPVVGKTVTERITHHKPLSPTASGVEVFQSVGSASCVLNIVSTGEQGEQYLTFTFEWDHPEIAPGSPEAVEKQKQHQTNSYAAVRNTIAKIREMVKEGKF